MNPLPSRMKVKASILGTLIILSLLAILFSTPIRRLLLTGIFKPLPPVHLTSELPTTFNSLVQRKHATLVIKNVHIVPMTTDTIWRNRDVVLHNGLIKHIAMSTDASYDEQAAFVIDGTDKYLIPGLSDMHTHINDDNNLLLFLAHGISLVRNMSGLDFHLDLKRALREDKILGPELLTTTPILEGPQSVWKNAPGSMKLKDLATVRPVVDSLIDLGYDEIKVYHTLSASFWKEVLHVAKSRDKQVVGHIPLDITLQAFADSHQASFEHVSYRQMESIAAPFSLDEKFAYLASQEKWICPTLIVNKYMFTENIAPTMRKEYAQYVDRKTKRFWRSRVKKGDSDYAKKAQLFEAFSAKSDKILSGTDCINAYVVPGISLHEELAELVACGLSNYEALRTSTYNVARYLGRLDQMGTIEEGKIARLVLLNDNPLSSIYNTRKIEGVVMDGKWISKAMIEEMLEQVRRQY